MHLQIKRFVEYLKTLTVKPTEAGADISENKYKVTMKQRTCWETHGWVTDDPPYLTLTVQGLIIFNAVLTREAKKKK